MESVFYAANVRSALKLGHARGVALLAAVEAGYPVFEYTPAEIKRAVVGYGRAEKHQVGEMVRLLLGLDAMPDAARRGRCAGGRHLPRAQRRRTPAREALARAAPSQGRRAARTPKSWREYDRDTMIAFLRGRLAEKQPEPDHRRRGAASGTTSPCRSRPTTRWRTRGGRGAARAHARARRHAGALRVCDGLELQIFERLISISGIGPKLALAVLSGIESPIWCGAVQVGDVARLTAHPGRRARRPPSASAWS